MVIANRIEPFFSLIRPGLHTSILEYLLLLVTLACLPIGAIISMGPMFTKDAHGKRQIYVINAFLAIIMLGGFGLLLTTLGTEIYRCDVLRIPNCD
jgi:hypothetical protein